MKSLFLALYFSLPTTAPEPVHFSISCSHDPAPICGRSGVTDRNALLTTCPHCIESDWHEYFHFVRSNNRNPRQGEVSYWPLEGE
jgi:hypothetical protein